MNSSPPISTVASGPGELSVLNTRKRRTAAASPTEPMLDFSIHMASQGGISTYWITPYTPITHMPQLNVEISTRE